MKTPAWALVAACGLTACDDADVIVEGSYTIATTNGANGCALPSWTVGEQAQGIPVVIRQEGNDVSADGGGGAAIGLGLLLGGNVFTGTVDGSRIDLTIVGTNNFKTGDCNYTFDADLTGKLSGDALAGTIEYRAITQDIPACASIRGCVTSQELSGTRPP